MIASLVAVIVAASDHAKEQEAKREAERAQAGLVIGIHVCPYCDEPLFIKAFGPFLTPEPVYRWAKTCKNACSRTLLRRDSNQAMSDRMAKDFGRQPANVPAH